MEKLQRISGESDTGCSVVALAAAIKIAEFGLDVLFIADGVLCEEVEQTNLAVMSTDQVIHSQCLDHYEYVFIAVDEPTKHFADMICLKCPIAEVFSVG